MKPEDQLPLPFPDPVPRETKPGDVTIGVPVGYLRAAAPRDYQPKPPEPPKAA
jgi:hypothetical protein